MPLWTPAEITTALWLDAADSSTLFDAVSGGSLVVADGGIARWEDKSGNGYHYTQSTAGARPIRKVSDQNGKDTALLSAGRFMESVAARVATRNVSSASAFVVRKFTNASGTGILLHFAVGSGLPGQARLSLATSATNQAFGRRLDADSVQAVLLAEADRTAWRTHNGFFDYANSDLALIVDGTQVAFSGSFQTAGNTSDTTSLVAYLGTNDGATSFLGNIAEVILVTNGITTEIRQLVEGYLAWKWGTQASLPNDHPYKNRAPGAVGIIPILRQHYAAMGAR
jgi:hypothetical protein